MLFDFDAYEYIVVCTNYFTWRGWVCDEHGELGVVLPYSLEYKIEFRFFFPF